MQKLFFVHVALLVLSSLVAAFGCQNLAQAPRDFEGEWTAQALLNRSVAAYGGAEAVIDYKDITVKCDISVFNGKSWTQGSTELRLKPPDRLLSKVNLQKGGDKVVYSNAEGQGEIINGKPTKRDVKADLLQSIRLTRIHAFFLQDQARHAEITATTLIEDKRCTVLTRVEGQEKWRIWIDLDRFLICKVRLVLSKAAEATSLPGALSVEWLFNDFKFQGIRNVPMSYETYLNGKLFQKGQVKEVKLNQGLKEEDFSS